METTIETIKKQVSTHLKSSQRAFLLGEDDQGIKYWLLEASWDCDWYWGFGYVETYNKGGKTDPAKCTDIDSHQHIDSFLGKQEYYDSEKGGWALGEYISNLIDSPKFRATTFTEDESWTLTELFNTFNTLKKTAEILGRGGSHTSSNPLADLIKNKAEVKRINQIVLPALFEQIYKILSPAH